MFINNEEGSIVITMVVTLPDNKCFITATLWTSEFSINHYGDVIMGAIASQITSLTSVYSIVHSDAGQRVHQSPASLAFVRGIHRGPVNSPHKWPVTRKMFPFDDVIMWLTLKVTKALQLYGCYNLWVGVWKQLVLWGLEFFVFLASYIYARIWVQYLSI